MITAYLKKSTEILKNDSKRKVTMHLNNYDARCA